MRGGAGATMNELTRRHFIRQSAAGAAAAMAAAATMAVPAVHVRASEAASSALLRWGIIGTGTRGNMTHVTALAAAGPAPECELLALCDVAEDRLQGAAKRARKQVETYSDYQKLLANPDVNAVVIATPNLQHKEMLAAALQAGKHVLCEKPAGISFNDAAAMQQATNAAKRVVMFGMQYRHTPKQAKIRELIEAGKIGKPKYIVQACSRGDWNLSKDVWAYADPKLFNGEARNWRFSHAASGGTLNEFSCHYFDLLHWFAGSPAPSAVSGDGGIAVYTDGRDTWDHASVTLTYPNGVKAVHTLSLFGTGRGDVTVMGEEGSIAMVGEQFQLISAPRKRKNGRGGGSIEEDIELDASKKPRGGADPAVMALYEDFVKCVKTGKKPDADAARAIAASRTCWLAELSAKRRAEVKWDETAA
jgi:predicted dehydrogenase